MISPTAVVLDLLTNEEAHWNAVQTRDESFDGELLYAVRSTGVYCRPSCPSRKPRREGVRFFTRPELAEQAGFRACKRCHPRMYEAARQNMRIDEELRLAIQVQERLYPPKAFSSSYCEAVGALHSCREVAGDYFDLLPNGHDANLMVALGDVAGKGIGAALLSSSLHAAIRFHAGLLGGCTALVARVNEYLYNSSPVESYATLFLGQIDNANKLLRYTNAGHSYPVLLRHSGEILYLSEGGLPVGMDRRATYSESSVPLFPGDLLAVFSDGIVEQRNDAGEEFGNHRLVQLLRANHRRPLQTLRHALDHTLRAFSGNEPQSDDQSYVFLRMRLAGQTF